MSQVPAALAELNAESVDPSDFVARVFANHVSAVALFDRAWRCTSWNERMELLTRIASEDAIGRTVQELFPTIDLRDRACFEAALGNECVLVPRRFFAVADVADRELFDTWFSPLHDRGGAVNGCCMLAIDRLTHRSARELLAESEQRFRTMADSAPVLLWMAGPDSRCTFFNQTWLQFTGRTLEQEVGFGWAEGVHPEDFRFCMDSYMEAFRTRKPFEMVYRLRRADGAFRWILDHGTPHFAAGGLFAGYIGSSIDVTELKTARDVAEETIDRLARSNAELERFAHAASHDLREPLRSVSIYAELLAERYRERLDPKADEYIDYLVGGVKQMKSLVDGLLQFALLKHTDPTTFKATSLDDAVTRALANLELATKESGAQVTVESLPTVRGSDLHLTQLFQNLVHNAVKFRGEKPPAIRIHAQPQGILWRVSVEDRGVGIDMRFADKLFTIFQRLGPRDARHGSGVGLAICQRIVELHGGRIWIESTPGQGTTVHFTLPRVETTE